MKPMSRKPHRFPGKRDYHPHKKHHKEHNWWEYDFSDDGSKKSDRQAAKREIEKQIILKD